MLLAHRVAYFLHFGNIPAERFICHRCDNRRCVNPGHLFVGTHADNMADKYQKRRQAFNKGERNGRSKLTKDDVVAIRNLPPVGLKEIGLRYGVSATVVSLIQRRISWKHI